MLLLSLLRSPHKVAFLYQHRVTITNMTFDESVVGQCSITLYRTPIITATNRGEWIIQTGGFNTRTTMRRLNELLMPEITCRIMDSKFTLEYLGQHKVANRSNRLVITAAEVALLHLAGAC